MSDLVNKAYQATPNATLRDQIMNPNFPKNEREWWAAARIEQLEAALREIAYFEISSSVGDIYGDTQKEWLEAFDRAQSVARAALGASDDQ